MIFIENKNSWVKNPADEINKVDGIQYAIICNVAVKNTTAPLENYIFYCSLYIPSIHGKFRQGNQNYPVVEIPYKQDSDDPGYQPQIGDICKVMFEGGRSDSCRLIHMLYIAEENRLLNQGYILDGILPTSIVNRPVNPQDYEQYIWMLDYAYYITTGHKKSELTYDDFKPYMLGSGQQTEAEGGSIARNLFCNALDMPFFSYFNTYNIGSNNTPPVEASDIYSVKNVIIDLYENHFDSIYNVVESYYTSNDYEFLYPEYEIIYSPVNIYNKCKELFEDFNSFMFCFVLSCITLCDPYYMNILFPEIEKDIKDKEHIIIWSGSSINEDTYPEKLWDIYSESGNVSSIAYMVYAKFLYNFKDIYEIEWLKVVAQYVSGCNNIMGSNIENLKLKYTIIMCLTICPYLAYPMFGYAKKEPMFIREISSSMSLINEIYDSNYEWRTYSTYLRSDEEFSEVRLKLVNLASKENIKPDEFVQGFRDIAFDVFGSGALTIQGEGVNTWEYCKMDAKFDRLKDILNEFTEKIK